MGVLKLSSIYIFLSSWALGKACFLLVLREGMWVWLDFLIFGGQSKDLGEESQSSKRGSLRSLTLSFSRMDLLRPPGSTASPPSYHSFTGTIYYMSTESELRLAITIGQNMNTLWPLTLNKFKPMHDIAYFFSFGKWFQGNTYSVFRHGPRWWIQSKNKWIWSLGLWSFQPSGGDQH